jgi:hypothetical protein
VRPPQSVPAWGLGWHWSDYAAYSPRRPSGPTRDLTDANVSYKTSELLTHASLLAEGVWGRHIRNAGSLPSYYESSAWIDYPCPHLPGVALQKRWLSGRVHGALRRPGLSGRVLFFISAPLLPMVLAWRGWQAARSVNYLRALPWVLAFHIWWTCGELAGCLSGQRSPY